MHAYTNNHHDWHGKNPTWTRFYRTMYASCALFFSSAISTILTAGPINYTALDVCMCVCVFSVSVFLRSRFSWRSGLCLFSAEELLPSNSLMQQQFRTVHDSPLFNFPLSLVLIPLPFPTVSSGK